MWWYCQFHSIILTEASQCHCRHMTVWNDCSSGQKVFFSATVKPSRGKWELQLSLAHTCPLSFPHRVVQRKWRMPQILRENRVTTFVKLWMLHQVLNLMGGSILVSRVRKWENVTDRQKTMCRNCQTRTNAHFWQFNKLWLHFFLVFFFF